jgi:hypothetical protein
MRFASMRIAHLSDPHLLDLDGVSPWRLLLNKRLTGYANILLKRGHAHRPRFVDAIVDERNEVRETYRKLLEPLGFVVQKANADVKHNVQSMAFTVPAGCHRNDLVSALKARGIDYDLRRLANSADGQWQLFCFDPNGARVELDFDASEAAPA